MVEVTRIEEKGAVLSDVDEKAEATELGKKAPERGRSPEFLKNPISYMFFLWFSPLLYKGYRKTIQYDDLLDMPEALLTDRVYPSFQNAWQQRLARTEQLGPKGKARVESARQAKSSGFLLVTIWRQHMWRILLALALQCFYSGIQFAGPIMLNQITTILTKPPEQQKPVLYKGYIFAVVMLMAPILGSLAAVMANRLSIGTQVMLRAELTAAIYRKALRLSNRAKQQTETGRIVNHMSADVNQLQSFFYPFANQLVTGPAMLIASVVLLWFQIKWATFIGLAILLISTPATGIFVKKITTYRREMLKHTDQRVKLMNQLLVGIRVLKLYAWESAQEAMVLEVRKKELGQLGKAIPYRVAMQTLLFAAPTLAMVTCFAVYGSVEPDSFTPATIFTAIAYFGLMRFPLIFLPFALVQLTNAQVSMRRLTGYFMLEERNEYVEFVKEPGVTVEDGQFFWAEPPPKPKEGEKGGKGSGGRKARRKARKLEAAAALEAPPAAGQVAAAEQHGQQNGHSVEPAANGTTNGVHHHHHANGDARVTAAKLDCGAAAGPDGGAVKVALSGMHDDDGEVAAGDGVGKEVAATGEQAKGQEPQGQPDWWLRDINIQVNPGELVCVVGRVGSGKSSLVSALLGEMEKERGSVKIGGHVAYASQQAWIVNATVKGNVTFGRPYDEKRWQMCVDACCLAADLDVLPAGAETEIGEKGINLSGGQKQRISLARALYQDADLYILDDPLSAVDVHVGKHIFDHFINGAIQGKARLLVTHQLQYLPLADKVVVMDGGRIVAQGTYDECLGNETFDRLLREHNVQPGSEAAAVEEEAGNAGVGAAAASAAAATDGALLPAGTPVLAGEESSLSAGSSVSEESEDEAGAAPGAHAVVRTDTKAMESRLQAEAVEQAPGTLGRAEFEMPQPRKGVSFVDPADKGAENEATVFSDMDASEGKPHKGGGGKGGLGRFETMKLHNLLGKKKEGKEGKGAASAGAPAPGGSKGSLMIQEDQEVGHVEYIVYWRYIKCYGIWAFAFLFFCFSGEQTLNILTTWWLSKWTGAELENSIATTLGLPKPNSRSQYIGGYVGLALGYVLLTGTRAFSNLVSCLRASRLIHVRTLDTLVRAPVTFFDTTPVGRILNRFSKDTDDVDFLLTMSFTEFFNCIFQLAAILIFIAVIQPWILCGIAPLGVVYFFLQRFYRASYIELQRLESVSRSPIYAHFSESLGGSETIRAYRMAERFALESDTKVDENHRAYFCTRMANEWLGQRLDVLGAIIVFLAAILAIVNRANVSPSLAAMTLSQALEVTMFLKSAVTAGANFETRFNSVERLTAYWTLPQEAPAKKPEVEPKEEWPEEGQIVYQDVWMRYRPELGPVLKGVSFDVKPGDKIGIVGRTGSGKSSLIVSLFRLVEPFKGRILMDGINILDLGLDDVRGRIAAIPQDPVLFSGTVRSNLDPYSRHTDVELWDALGHTSLKATVAGMAEGLSARVAEGGDNFSVGQRQLLCVARALLRQPRVLVADEATASVDAETDALIQRTIRREFKHCTVLTIAHRINTILDSSRVLVMEDGLVKEYDSVPRLMGRTDSTFRRMVVSAGLEGTPTGVGSRRGSASSLASIQEVGTPRGGSDGGEAAAGQTGGQPQEQRRKPEGLKTFVNRFKDEHGLE